LSKNIIKRNYLDIRCKEKYRRDIRDKIKNGANNDLLSEIEQIKNKIDINSRNEIYNRNVCKF
jgi:hypothetical protein